MDLARFEEFVRKMGCMVQHGQPMADFTTLRIGGPAELVVTIPSEAAATLIVSACRIRQIPFFFLGNGSNLLCADEGIPGVVLRLDGRRNTPACEGETLLCPAGVPLQRACRVAEQNGLAGLEFAYGIPGSVGGGVYMNAGAYDGQIADVLEKALLLLPDGSLREVTAEEMQMGYRHTALQENGAIVLRAQFRLRRDDPASIRARMEDYMQRRQTKQPLEWPSAGSFFKRPQGAYAGQLIEQCGFKGAQVGGAQISEKHAGFLINRGNATCEDVLQLAHKVRAGVLEQTGFVLEPEVKLIGGRDWLWNS